MARRRAVPGREQGEAVVESARDLGQVERVQAGRGQLDGERETVEPAHDLGDALPVGGVGLEARHDGAGPVDEQPDGVIVGVPGRQRRDGEELFAGESQALPAGRDRRDVRATRQQTVDERGDRIEDMLAVVEQQQHVGVAEAVGDAFDAGRPAPGVDAEGGGDGVQRGGGIGGGELAERDRAVRAVGLDAPAGLDQEPGLADPARSDQRHQPGAIGERGDLGDGGLATDQRGRRRRQPRRANTGGRHLGGEEVGVLRDQRRRRVDAQLVAQTATEVVERPEGFRRPAAGRERRHEERARPLPQRLRVDQCREHGDGGVGVAGGEEPFGLALPSAKAHLLEAGRLGPAVVDVGQFRIGRTLPAIEELVEVGGVVGPGRRGQHCGQPVDVELDGGRLEAVAAVDRGDHALRQGAAKPEDVVLHGHRGVAGNTGRPECVGGGIDRDDAPAAQRQQGQQSALQDAGGREVAPADIADSNGPEDVDAQSGVALQHGVIPAPGAVAGWCQIAPVGRPPPAPRCRGGRRRRRTRASHR